MLLFCRTHETGVDLSDSAPSPHHLFVTSVRDHSLTSRLTNKQTYDQVTQIISLEWSTKFLNPSLLLAACVLVNVSCSRVTIDLDLRGWIKMRWNKDGELLRSEAMTTSDPELTTICCIRRTSTRVTPIVFYTNMCKLWLLQFEPVSQQQLKPRYMCCIVDMNKAHTDHRIHLGRSTIPS